MEIKLKRSQEATGITQVDLLNPPEILPQFIHVWEWFDDLNMNRDRSMGLSPIKYTEIKAYFDLLGIKYNTIELDILLLIDSLYLQESIKK